MSNLKGHALGGSRRANGHWQSGSDGRIHVIFDFPLYKPGSTQMRPFTFGSAPGIVYDFGWAVPYTTLVRGKNSNIAKDDRFVRIEVEADFDLRFFASAITTTTDVLGHYSRCVPALYTGTETGQITPYITAQQQSTDGIFGYTPFVLSNDTETEPYTETWFSEPEVKLLTKGNKIIYYGVERTYVPPYTGAPVQIDHVWIYLNCVSFDSATDQSAMPTGKGRIKIDGVTDAEVLNKGRWLD